MLFKRVTGFLMRNSELFILLIDLLKALFPDGKISDEEWKVLEPRTDAVLRKYGIRINLND